MTQRDPQSDLLQTWRHNPAPAPSFNSAVWTRIEASRQTASPLLFYRWALPLAACLALVIGAGAAMSQVNLQHDQRMAASLVRSIDPLQMAGHHHAP